MNNTVPIFFSIDDSYAPFLSVALRSAIDNCSHERQYRAIVLYESLTAENTERLSALSTDNFTVELVPMRNGLDMITDKMGNRLRCDYFTLTIYFRLFIPAMFPQYDKGIYIDSDVVVNGDIGELFDTDIGDCLIGACADKSVAHVPQLTYYMENAIGADRHEYINSGVLLMNLKLLREVELEKHFLELFCTYGFDCIAPDQDYLNALCHGRIYFLDSTWDAMPNDSEPPVENAKLIHYNLFSKPWCYDGIQYEEIFWSYAEKSGYTDEISAFKKNYSEEQKLSDAACMKLLLERGASIPKSDVTFKKMLEKGIKIRL